VLAMRSTGGKYRVTYSLFGAAWQVAPRDLLTHIAMTSEDNKMYVEIENNKREENGKQRGDGRTRSGKY
jgi:hypothetical protein